MKVPTTGTSVFSTSISSSTTGVITSGFVTDVAFTLDKTGGGSGYGRNVYSRLQGNFRSLNTTTTGSTISNSTTISLNQNNGIYLNGGGVYSTGYVYEQFQRAPGFMDVVCYTGTGSGTTITHNLGVAPELIITKKRSFTSNWGAFHSFTPTQNMYNYLDSTGAGFNATYGAASRAFQSQPTSTQYVTGGQDQIDTSGQTYVNYLFATCPGVSKVGSYTGTGTTQTINCGFTAGSRFILIKRTDSTGAWYVWDSARGIIAGNDPYLLLNSDAAEVTGTDYIDTANSGFEISSTAPAAINANGGTFIFLAIA
jgi:hypothetical protein